MTGTNSSEKSKCQVLKCLKKKKSTFQNYKQINTEIFFWESVFLFFFQVKNYYNVVPHNDNGEQFQLFISHIMCTGGLTNIVV